MKCPWSPKQPFCTRNALRTESQNATKMSTVLDYLTRDKAEAFTTCSASVQDSKFEINLTRFSTVTGWIVQCQRLRHQVRRTRQNRFGRFALKQVKCFSVGKSLRPRKTLVGHTKCHPYPQSEPCLSDTPLNTTR